MYIFGGLKKASFEMHFFHRENLGGMLAEVSHANNNTQFPLLALLTCLGKETSSFHSVKLFSV